MNLHALIESENCGHSRRVSEISGLLAEYMGYSRNEAGIIGQAALYHDLGKSDIPQDILNKPGPLTAREFEIVKMHTRLGSERIKEALRVLTAADMIAKNHHEKWDGSGYHGIAGENIHPYARLVCVADVLDALASNRVYKDAWSINEVFRYFIRQSGIQFDTGVVTALLAHADEIAVLYDVLKLT